jgi:cell division initiation protein
MPLTPLDIESRRFKREFTGFSRNEVGTFLRAAADALSQATLEREELGRMLQAARAEVDDYRHRERILIDALAASEKIGEERRAVAQKEAERIVGEARLQAEQLLARTRDEVTRLQQHIIRVKTEREMFESRLSALLDEHRRLLDLRRQEASVTDRLRAGRTSLPPTPENE